MKSLFGIVLAVLPSAISCGATFLFALHQQLALAVGLAAGVKCYFLITKHLNQPYGG